MSYLLTRIEYALGAGCDVCFRSDPETQAIEVKVSKSSGGLGYVHLTLVDSQEMERWSYDAQIRDALLSDAVHRGVRVVLEEERKHKNEKA